MRRTSTGARGSRPSTRSSTAAASAFRRAAATIRRPPTTAQGVAGGRASWLSRLLHSRGVVALPGAHRYLDAAGRAGVRRAVLSASANTATILERTGLDGLIDLQVDAELLRAEPIRSRPAPDVLLYACRRLGVDPSHAVTVTRSPAGVAAGKAAGPDGHRPGRRRSARRLRRRHGRRGPPRAARPPPRIARPDPASRPPSADLHRCVREAAPRGYLTSESILNIGRYIEMMITPTTRPTQIIISGSMIDVSVAMAVSTSSS